MDGGLRTSRRERSLVNDEERRYDSTIYVKIRISFPLSFPTLLQLGQGEKKTTTFELKL